LKIVFRLIEHLSICPTVLASSLVYNISDGQFTSRADLMDAAGSSLGRGALVPGLGKK
jgi:hypothetical protein